MNDIHHLSGAYAVDALDELERARFEAHLAECADCRAEVDSLREAAGLLASTTEVTPPPSLRDSVLAGISQVRPLPPAGDPAPAPTASRRRRWLPLVAAAVLVAVAGVGVAVTDPFGDLLDDTGTSQVPLSAAEQVLRADDAQSVAIDLGEAGRATVTRSASVGKAVIRTEDMASAPEGKVYELWLQSPAGEMVPAGLMPDERETEMVLEGDASRATAAGITVEPDGGSPRPTSEPIALFDFTTAS